MNRIIASLLLLTAFCAAPILAASPWTPIAEKLEKAVYFLQQEVSGQVGGGCTGFMINSEKKYILTAAHCDAEKVLVNGTMAIRMFKDDRKDLMVLRADQLEGPSLTLAKDGPDIADEVASMGFGYAFEKPLFRRTHISQVRLDVQGLSGPFFVTDTTFIPGQSGGPVVNLAGEVVMIVQRGDQGGLGMGVDAEVIKDRVGRYFGEK